MSGSRGPSHRRASPEEVAALESLYRDGYKTGAAALALAVLKDDGLHRETGRHLC